jgi:predicted O-methyltransferase YrrM
MSSQHRPTFVRLAQSQGWTRGAELGVDKGILFHQLLSECPDLHLIGVDVCPVPHRKQRCQAIAAEYAERATLHVMTTEAAADLVEDGSLDFVFIDADHSQRAVAIDIARWAPKVRAGGWVGGHDYNRKFPGVIAAVDRVYGGRVETWAGSIWGVWC